MSACVVAMKVYIAAFVGAASPPATTIPQNIESASANRLSNVLVMVHNWGPENMSFGATPSSDGAFTVLAHGTILQEFSKNDPKLNFFGARRQSGHGPGSRVDISICEVLAPN